MSDLDNDFRLQVRTKSDRPVMNTSDTPEYINLATHYNERISKDDTYESIHFTEDSLNYLSAIEDEALLRGDVKPVVRTSVKNESFTSKVFNPEEYNNNVRESEATEVKQVGTLPYRDIPGDYASFDTIFAKPEKYIPHQYVPSNVVAWYNPFLLIGVSITLILLILAEIVGLIYVF